MAKLYTAPGVGSPAIFYLHEFGRIVYRAFGEYPLLVGSCLDGKSPRDIDVRLVVSNARWKDAFQDFHNCYLGCSKYSAMCMAFSALGEKMTGLPIDFQIQFPGMANKFMDRPRLELGRENFDPPFSIPDSSPNPEQ